MDYEYVALKWIAHGKMTDEVFLTSYHRLREGGWEELCRAQFEKYVGGACIMRRPKDEPLTPEQRKIARGLEARLREIEAQYKRRMRAADEVRRHEEAMRESARKSASLDEPRMWTESELQELMRAQLRRTELRVDVAGIGHLDEPSDDDIAAVCANT